MAGPNIKDKKKEKKIMIILCAVTYLIALYIGQHVAHSGVSDISELDLVTLHLQQHPFSIFPIKWDAVLMTTYICFIVIALINVEILRKKRVRTDGEHGSAAWNTDLDEYNKIYTYPKGKPFAEKSPSEKNKNMILSQNVCLNMDTRATMRNNNIVICGGSGSGKTRFEVKPNILQANCSYVITDPSGELLESMGGFLKQQGYKIKVFNLVQMDHSHCYNPFKYIRNEEGVLTMITALIKNTTPKGSSSNDPFWEKAETALLQAICFYLYFECREEDRSFSNVMKLLRCAEVKEDRDDYKSTLDIMFEQLKERDPEHIAVRQYAVFKQAAGKTAKSILVSASVRLAIFNLKAIGRLTGSDNLDLHKLGDEKTALFCITPVVDTTFNFLVALLYTQIFESLYFHAETQCEGKRLPIHVRFLLDEFANIGTIPDFEQKLATMRKYEISCTIIIQNMAQLKTMYKDSWESITGNCDTFIFLGGQEQATLEYVSKMLGKETIVTQTDSRSFGKGGGSTRNKTIIGRELMTPDEIGLMSTMDCIVRIRGIKPFFGPKYDYPKHPNYKYTGDADKRLQYDVTKEIPAERNTFMSDGERFRAKREMHRERIMRARQEGKELESEQKRGNFRKSLKGVPLNQSDKVTEEALMNITQSNSIQEAGSKLRTCYSNDVNDLSDVMDEGIVHSTFLTSEDSTDEDIQFDPETGEIIDSSSYDELSETVNSDKKFMKEDYLSTFDEIEDEEE